MAKSSSSLHTVMRSLSSSWSDEHNTTQSKINKSNTYLTNYCTYLYHYIIDITSLTTINMAKTRANEVHAYEACQLVGDP